MKLPTRRRRRVALAAVALVTVTTPAWAEAIPRTAISRHGSCTSPGCLHAGAMDFDALGLRLTDVEFRSSQALGSASELRIGPTPTGLRVVARGLDATLTLGTPAPSSGETSPATEQAPPRTGHTAKNDHSPLGIPATLTAPGGVIAIASMGIQWEVHDPVMHVGGDGAVRGHARIDAQHPHGSLASVGPVALRARALAQGPWHARGQAAWTGGDPFRFHTELTRSNAKITVETERGALAATLADGRETTLSLTAANFPMDLAPELSAAMQTRTGLHVEGGRVDADLRMTHSDRRTRVEIEDVVVRDVRLKHRRLALDWIMLGTVSARGQLNFAAQRLHGRLELGHDRLRARVVGDIGAMQVKVDAELPETDCQQLLDSAPRGLFDILEGMQVEGSVQGSLHVEFRPEDLGGSSQSTDRTPGDKRLQFEFPALDRCKVVRDPPLVDLPALAGSYRHRFRTDGGEVRERILARGTAGYVRLNKIPLLARAFITLEDARFLHHDGFDRRQIERAFWHNLALGRISRGASTITQQTARNLWLGGNRSMARKLQEAVLASRLENHLDKERILELYLNIIELGPQVFGVADAARYHFGKDPEDLNVLQAVHLASLAPAPRTLSVEFRDGQTSRQWREELRRQVRRLYLHGFLTRVQMQRALEQELQLVDHHTPS